MVFINTGKFRENVWDANIFLTTLIVPELVVFVGSDSSLILLIKLIGSVKSDTYVDMYISWSMAYEEYVEKVAVIYNYAMIIITLSQLSYIRW